MESDARYERLLLLLRGQTAIEDRLTVLRAGSLKKEGKKFPRTWKRRYFVLTEDGLLLYFSTMAAWDASDKPLGGLVVDASSELSLTDILTVKASRSCTLGKEECRDRIFLLKGDDMELHGWLTVLKQLAEVGNAEISENGGSGAAEMLCPPPFKAFDTPPSQPAAQTGLSMSAQRSIQENEFYKLLNLDKMCRLLMVDDIALAVDWLGLDGVDNMGFVVYNQVLGQLVDALNKCDKNIREAIARQWEKPLLCFRRVEDNENDEENDDDVVIENGELVVLFRVGQSESDARIVGKRLAQTFGV